MSQPTIEAENKPEPEKKQPNVMIKRITIAAGILIFQLLYFQGTVWLLRQVADCIPVLSNAGYNIIHHTLQFLPLFLITFVLHQKKIVDFGYHRCSIKACFKWMSIGIAAEVLIRLIVGIIYGFDGSEANIEDYIFQLFFSGLGEEIPYRSLPLALMSIAFGKAWVIRLGKRIHLDIAVLISAIFFSVAHISFQIGVWEFSFGIPQLIASFVVGLILGYAYRKTNSVWVCMLIHGAVNVIAISIA